MKNKIKLTLLPVLILVALQSLSGQLLPNADARKVRHLILFVSFTDQLNEPWSRSLSGWRDVLNSDDPTSFSVRSYYTKASYGKVDFRMNFVDDNNASDTVCDYVDKYPTSYYKLQKPYNALGAKDLVELNKRTDSLLVRLVAWANTKLPNNIEIDGDKDGKIDGLIVLCRKLEVGDEFLLSNWNGGFPWRGTQATYPLIRNMGYYKFSSISAYSYNNPFFNAIFTHELGHWFGLPDVYSSGFSSYRTLKMPAMDWWYFNRSYTSYYLWSNLGWIPKDNAKLITKSGTYAINSLHSDTPTDLCVRVKSPNSNTEFFMLEYRGRHSLEYWHNSEGLLVSLINPVLNGNNRGHVADTIKNYGSWESNIIRPKSGIAEALMLNTSLSANSDPALRLSDGKPAGFQINNIRKVDNKLYFDIKFEDEPFITAYETPDIIGGYVATKITWDISVNPSNIDKWTALSSDVSWLRVTPDYQNQKLNISINRNAVETQRTATITLSAPGAKDYKAYLVQRGSSNGSVLWVPEAVNDTITVDGNENSYNCRIIGDLKSDWWLPNYGTDYPRISTGISRDLDTRYRGFFVSRNNTGAKRNFTLKYKIATGEEKSITVRQLVPTTPAVNYQTSFKSVPVKDDLKWYYVRSERSANVKQSYLGPKKDANGNIVLGIRAFALNDSLLWTVETAGAGVVLRNKALGYVDMTIFNSNRLRFTSTKPNTSFSMIENSGSWEYPIIGCAFQGTSPLKGIHIATDDYILPTYFNITDNCTLFFTKADLYSIINYGNEYFKGLNAGTNIGNTSEIAYNRLQNALQNALVSGQQASEEQIELLKLEIATAVQDVKNNLILFQTSTANNPVWYRIGRNEINNWLILYQDQVQYLKSMGYNNAIVKENIVLNDDKFLFRFQKGTNGKYIIISKAYPTYAIAVSTTTDKVALGTISNPAAQLDLLPTFTSRGVLFMIRYEKSINNYLHLKGVKETNAVINKQALNLGISNNFYDEEYLFNLEYMEGTTGVRSVPEGSKFINYKIVDRKIILENQLAEASVYDLKGNKHDITQQLAQGIYVLQVNGISQKVLVY